MAIAVVWTACDGETKLDFDDLATAVTPPPNRLWKAGSALGHNIYEGAQHTGCQDTKTSETAPIMRTSHMYAARAIWLDWTSRPLCAGAPPAE